MIILSPSKTLGNVNLNSSVSPSLPHFVEQASEVVNRLRELSEKELTQLLDVNPKLGRLNYERYIAWNTPFTQQNSRFALASFKGDVFEGLNAASLSQTDLEFAQKHLRILSGLYGVLRPFDLFQPYRLEMATRIEIDGCANLYDFWKEAVTGFLNNEFETNRSDLLINLASKEYFTAIDFSKIKARIVTPEFRQFNNGNPKVVPILAKRARGLMAHFIITHRALSIDELMHFDYEGYVFSPDLSSESNPVFVRQA